MVGVDPEHHAHWWHGGVCCAYTQHPHHSLPTRATTCVGFSGLALYKALPSRGFCAGGQAVSGHLELALPAGRESWCWPKECTPCSTFWTETIPECGPTEYMGKVTLSSSKRNELTGCRSARRQQPHLSGELEGAASGVALAFA